MLTCATFEERLYDEDCRAALRNRSAVPDDVTSHLQTCGRCGQAFAEMADDLALLAGALSMDPPAHLRVALLRTMESALGPRSPMIAAWRRTASWAAAAGAVATGATTAVLGAPLSPLGQAAVFVLAASLMVGSGLLVETLKGAPRARAA